MKSTSDKIVSGLAGQQNAGKSTIFNMLAGATQHIDCLDIELRLHFYRHRESVETS